MLNSTSIRALAVLILAAAPAMASIPSDSPSDVEIRIGGAELILPNTYAVNQYDVISLAVTARPGDLIWAYALPLDANLEWSGEMAHTLLFDRDVTTGMLSTDLMVPLGATGAFLVAAVAIGADGEPRPSVNKIVKVRPRMIKHVADLGIGVPAMLDE